jgi:hypothetical protein
MCDLSVMLPMCLCAGVTGVKSTGVGVADSSGKTYKDLEDSLTKVCVHISVAVYIYVCMCLYY